MLLNSRLKIQVSRLKYWIIMQNVEFANSNQTKSFTYKTCSNQYL